MSTNVSNPNTPFDLQPGLEYIGSTIDIPDYPYRNYLTFYNPDTGRYCSLLRRSVVDAATLEQLADVEFQQGDASSILHAPGNRYGHGSVAYHPASGLAIFNVMNFSHHDLSYMYLHGEHATYRDTGKVRAALIHVRDERGEKYKPLGVSISADGQRLALGRLDGRLDLYNLVRGEDGAISVGECVRYTMPEGVYASMSSFHPLFTNMLVVTGGFQNVEDEPDHRRMAYSVIMIDKEKEGQVDVMYTHMPNQTEKGAYPSNCLPMWSPTGDAIGAIYVDPNGGNTSGTGLDVTRVFVNQSLIRFRHFIQWTDLIVENPSFCRDGSIFCPQKTPFPGRNSVFNYNMNKIVGVPNKSDAVDLLLNPELPVSMRVPRPSLCVQNCVVSHDGAFAVVCLNVNMLKSVSTSVFIVPEPFEKTIDELRNSVSEAAISEEGGDGDLLSVVMSSMFDTTRPNFNLTGDLFATRDPGQVGTFDPNQLVRGYQADEEGLVDGGMHQIQMDEES